MYMYVWKQHTEILEMTIKKVENCTCACTDSEAVGIIRKRSPWTSDKVF